MSSILPEQQWPGDALQMLAMNSLKDVYLGDGELHDRIIFNFRYYHESVSSLSERCDNPTWTTLT